MSNQNNYVLNEYIIGDWSRRYPPELFPFAAARCGSCGRPRLPAGVQGPVGAIPSVHRTGSFHRRPWAAVSEAAVSEVAVRESREARHAWPPASERLPDREEDLPPALIGLPIQLPSELHAERADGGGHTQAEAQDVAQ